jgi:hypothetical protein
MALFTAIVTSCALLTAYPASASPTPDAATAGKSVVATEVSPATHSFLDPVDDFVKDSIVRPTSPFKLVPGKDPNGWQFLIEPYLWAMGISGKTGVGSLPAMNANESAKTLLQHLDWGIMSKAEIRKGRWGLLADGYFVDLSAAGNLNGGLYQSGSLGMQQSIASLALAYRIIDDRRGFLDFYAGARYNYLGMQVSASPDPARIASLSDQMTDRLAAGINTKVSAVLASNAGIIQSDLQNQVQQQLTSSALEKITDMQQRLDGAVNPSALQNLLSTILGKTNGALADYVAAEAAARIAAAKGELTAALQSRVDAAKQKLASQLAGNIVSSLPTKGSSSEWWVDPIVGLRTQINLTRTIFLAAQGDVGGFAVGSQITWNTQASIGFNFTRNIYSELGYRYMYVDYNKSSFLYNMNSYGLFVGLGFKL